MTPKPTQDWIELLQSLVKNEVEFIIVGAFALAFHGHPRYTGDLDLFFRCDARNADRLLSALTEFGAPVAEITADSLAEPGTTLSFGVPPSKVELLNWLSGLDWQSADSDAVTGEFGGVSVRFLSRKALIQNKTAAGRPQDLADVSHLVADWDPN